MLLTYSSGLSSSMVALSLYMVDNVAPIYHKVAAN